MIHGARVRLGSSYHSTAMTCGHVVLVVQVWMSGLTFGMYAWDKWRACRMKHRVAGATLLWMDFLGCWPAAFITQSLVRHRSLEKSFLVVLYGIVFVHLVAWCTLAWITWGGSPS
jgi:uncharacterized membrane protein YsdA (DUF1294 family)